MENVAKETVKLLFHFFSIRMASRLAGCNLSDSFKRRFSFFLIRFSFQVDEGVVYDKT